MIHRRSSLTLAAAIFAAAFISCRTGRPSGSPVAPLTATSAEEAMAQLQARRDAFRPIRSLMKVRATHAGETQTFRAQLAVLDARRMELIAYTPVGTTAMTMKADGDHVTVDNRLQQSEWEGSAADLASSFGFLGSSLTPAEMAMLMIGLPPRSDLQYDVDASGLRRAVAGDVTVTFDPPSFPASHVVVTRGTDRVEIEHLEVLSE